MNDYPRLTELGIQVCCELQGPPYVRRDTLHIALKTKAARGKFAELFGTQTCPAGGYYPWDVEAVLERMMSGKLTGSQAIWD